MLLDVMPRPLATLFADRWDTRFPAYPWKNDAAAGSLLVDGISTKLEQLGVLYATCDAKEVVPSPELWAKLAHDDLIWVNGEQFKIIVIARQPADFTQNSRLRTVVTPSSEQSTLRCFQLWSTEMAARSATTFWTS
jgi:hypothetical protein